MTPISARQNLAGTSGHSGARGTVKSDGPSQPIYVAGKWSADTKAAKYFIVLNNAGSLEDVGSFIVPGGIPGTFAAALKLSAGTYILGELGLSGSIGVYSGHLMKDGPGDGWSIGRPDVELTRSMIAMAVPHGALRF